MTTAQELYDQLDRKHPDFEEWSEEWELYRDVIGDVLVEVGDYLPQNKLEANSQYEFRKELAQWIPETPGTIGKLVEALYDEKPKRDLKNSRLDQLAEDVDREGTNLNDFMERVVRLLLTYGSSRVLVNVPQLGHTAFGPQPTRADEIEQGIRPFLILYSPLSVPNWDADQHGRLTMVLIKEQHWRKEVPSEPASEHLKITRFVMYTQNEARWWEFREDPKAKERLTLIGEDEAEHGLGVVPMVVEYFPLRLRTMIGSAFVRYMSRADVQLFQDETDMHYDGFIHAHPTLRVWTDDAMADVGVGTQHFLKLKPGDPREDASYMDVPESAHNILKSNVENRLAKIYRQAGTDPLGVVNAGTAVMQASGVARAWSFGTSEARLLSDLAGSAVRLERGIFSLAAGYYGEDFDGSVQYPEEFDLSSTETLIGQTERIQEIVNSPKLVRALHKRIAASKVGDASAHELAEIYDEIDENPLFVEQPAAGRSTPAVFNMPEVEVEEEEEAAPPSGRRQPAQFRGTA